MVREAENTLAAKVDWARQPFSHKKGLARAIIKSKTDEEFITRIERIQARKFHRIGDLIWSDINKIHANPNDESLYFLKWERPNED